MLSDVTEFYCFAWEWQECVGISTAQYKDAVVPSGMYVDQTAAQVCNVAFCVCLYMI